VVRMSRKRYVLLSWKNYYKNIGTVSGNLRIITKMSYIGSKNSLKMEDVNISPTPTLTSTSKY